MKRNYFFFNKTNRESYQNVYNYYILSPFNNFFPTQLDNRDSFHEKNKLPFEKQREFIDKIFQEIDHAKKFLLTYEEKYYS